MYVQYTEKNTAANKKKHRPPPLSGEAGGGYALLREPHTRRRFVTRGYALLHSIIGNYTPMPRALPVWYTTKVTQYARRVSPAIIASAYFQPPASRFVTATVATQGSDRRA